MTVEVLRAALLALNSPIHVSQIGQDRYVDDAWDVAQDGVVSRRTVAWVPALTPASLGDPAFRAAHGVRYAYVVGEMANGIAGTRLVAAVARAGMLGFFGAAGLEPERVDRAIETLGREAAGRPFGFNLIHSPSEPRVEATVSDLYIRRGVRTVCASAYLDLTLPLVRYRVARIRRGPDGVVETPNKVFGKVSRIEVARKFLSPAPEAMVAQLVRESHITSEQAELARRVPLCDDLTAEADSGGHTDNRPAITLIPTLVALRDAVQREFGYVTPPRVGAAGGIATPESVAAAFAMGAAYVLTGTINQSCREADTSETVKQMLAEAEQADVIMAPAADMFEMGVKVQVLKRGTMFAIRARKLYDLYRTCESVEALPAGERAALERDIFRAPLEEVWRSTKDFFAGRDPSQIERAERDPTHKLALIFRSYLGQSSNWANSGEPTRKIDYQVWCGPAMGAFNEWVRGTPLEKPEGRDAVTVARNLLVGAAVVTRANWLRMQGVAVPSETAAFRARGASEIAAIETQSGE
jgi:PfaD family protein